MIICISVVILKSTVVFQRTEKSIICQHYFKNESFYVITFGVQNAHIFFLVHENKKD